MWIICTIVTFFCWGIADLFYKIGNQGKGDYNHLKTGVFVGLVMGIHAVLFLITNNIDISITDTVKYLPVSFFYISSMVIGYKGLKYLELSVSSPIQNCSGVITCFLLLIIFKESFDIPFYIAVAFILIGILLLSYSEMKENKKARLEFKHNNKTKKVIVLTIVFPLIYCILDGAGTFLDGIYLDKLNLISEDNALLAYEFTFATYALITYIYLKIKKVKINLFDEKPKLFAALFETAGQFFYVYAMSGNATISAPIIGSYCVLSLLLSRIFLKEKLSKREYLAISLVLIGIVTLAILDV